MTQKLSVKHGFRPVFSVPLSASLHNCYELAL